LITLCEEEAAMSVPIFQVDAFTDVPFAGNPAAVCLLDRKREAEWMQAVAAEMNFSETAFVLSDGDDRQLRWFTPQAEVPLCGHATLATAHVLRETGALRPEETARFQTKSGLLTARLQGSLIELDFPAFEPSPATVPQGLLAALGVRPLYTGRSGLGPVEYLLEVESDGAVRALNPDFRRLAEAYEGGVVVTARSDSSAYHFVSRFFAPGLGVDEDPVTGAAHCVLGPYWGAKLGESEVTGYQASKRGGIVRVRLAGERVRLRGHAVTVVRGELLE
jgi:PhzF family phenazine biosynthesis protein